MGSKEPELVNTLQDGVRVIRFNRPEKKNALSRAVYKGLTDALIEAGEDSDTKITVITGTGDYFTSGNDLSNFTGAVGGASSRNDGNEDERSETTEEAIKKGTGWFEELINILIDFPKPIIAVVNGPAVGLGVTMLGLVDAVYASDKATFHTPFVRSALSPEGCSTYLFPRIMGPGKAAEMLLFSEKITAEDAFQHGLVTKVYPADSLHKIWPKIQGWAKLPPKSLANAKSLLSHPQKEQLRQVNKIECEQLARTFTSEEFISTMMEYFARKSKL